MAWCRFSSLVGDLIMRYRLFVSLCAFTVIAVAFAPFSGGAWLPSVHSANNASDFEKNRKRYLLQIERLKQALQQSETNLDAERKLSADLQRELRDANGQVQDMSDDLDRLRNQVPTKISSTPARPNGQTIKVMVMERSDSFRNKSFVMDAADVEAQTSLYAPGTRFIVRPKRLPPLMREKTGNIVELKPDSFNPDGTKSAQLQYAASGITEKVSTYQEAQALPSAKRTTHNKPQSRAPRSYQTVKQQSSSHSADTRQPQTPNVSSPKRKSKTSQRRKIARLTSRANLGYSQSGAAVKRSQPKAQRKKKTDVFKRLARQGVFGDGYVN